MTINGPTAPSGQDRGQRRSDPPGAAGDADAAEPPEPLTPEALAVLRLEVRLLALTLGSRGFCDR